MAIKNRFHQLTHWLRTTRIDLPLPRIHLRVPRQIKRNSRRIVHGMFFALLAAITLLVLVYAEENWRGARAWAAVQSEWQARGESLDIKDSLPPPIPDDQNLAMAPLFARAFHYQIDPVTHLLTFSSYEQQPKDLDREFNKMLHGDNRAKLPYPETRANWATAHGTDLTLWQRYYRSCEFFPHTPQPQTAPADVLLALTQFSTVFDELAQAADERPLGRFPVNWRQRPSWDVSLPHNYVLWTITAALRVRASAQLAASQPAAAMRDIKLMFRLRQTIADDPTLQSAIHNYTCTNLFLQPIWEGLATRQWSAAELDALRENLRSIDMLRIYQRAFRSSVQNAFLNDMADDLQDRTHARRVAHDSILMQENSYRPSAALRFWMWMLPYLPRGSYAQNVAIISRYNHRYLAEAVNLENRRITPTKNAELGPALEKLPLGPNTVLAKTLLRNLENISLIFAWTQSAIDHAATACALEKYYLDHHAYPAALSALVPMYLDHVPTDVIDGAPMRYRLTVNGRYQLYSIGWNEKDDGGAIEWFANRTWRRTADGKVDEAVQRFPFPDRHRADWVWQYAPAEPPDPPNNQSRLESLP